MKAGLRGGIALLATLLACACGGNDKDDIGPGGSDDAATDPTPDPGEASLDFAPDRDAAMAGSFQQAFDMLETRDIIAVVALPEAAGTHILKLEITQPSGTPYQTILRAFSSDPDAPETIAHPTLGEDLQVERVTAEAGMSTLYLGIPVAGTDITRHRLTGTFPVDVRLEEQDGAEPLARSSFDITLSM